MDAAAGGGFAYAGLIGSAVDLDIAGVGIHITAAIEARLQPFQPEDACRDFGVGKLRLRDMANDFASFENCSGLYPSADFLGDAVESQRRLIGAFDLPDAKARGGTGEYF